MAIAEEVTSSNAETTAVGGTSTLSSDLKSLLERTLGVRFTILDGQTGDIRHAAPDQPSRDWGLCAEMCREVARRGQPEFIDDDEPVLTLALPLMDAMDGSTVAVATFLTRKVEPTENLSRQAELLGMRPNDALAWARRQTPWTAEMIQRVSDLVLEGARTNERAKELQWEADSLSINLASTCEEISLLYRLIQNLKLSKSDEDLARLALEWMRDIVPAAGLVIQLAPVSDADAAPGRVARTESTLLSDGECPIGNSQFSELTAYFGTQSRHQPIVANRAATEQPGWPCPQIREMIAVPLVEGEHVFGWLAALNHVEGGEFGVVEANVLSSVATILGIHGCNLELYQEQSELLTNVVRALTSAIDAKDPYTCGHSDRVARVAVRLAEEIGCDAKTRNTLYLAGLLHDIGKIGIDDSVLRKPGTLSDEEYAYIKEHVNIGHHLLDELVKLEEVLPAVLYHHESWDGGYPHQLDCQRIPLSARIVAVADAFDAMSSDRPYRKRMPDEKVDEILSAGAGQQWDPDVIGAYFRIRDDIRRLCRGEKQPPGLEVTRQA